ncbi:MAG TPA: glycosyltransferase [Desulfomonilaceae bacterium]|nr:glycosyltransferase [Desulfomonilaceae bacterium]
MSPCKNSSIPRVSVCIPSYNAEKYIGQTIRSVLDSTYSDFEIIVQDDASTDKTFVIAQDFTDERVRCFRNSSNRGPVMNWNLSLRKASGEFVGLLNHDDLYSPFWLEFAVHHLDRKPHLGWVVTAGGTIDPAGNVLSFGGLFSETREYGPSESFPELAKLNGLKGGFLVRRAVLDEVGYYDEAAGPGADNELFLRLASKYPFFFNSRPHAAVFWRLHGDNLTHTWGDVEQATESFYILDKIFSDTELPHTLRRYAKPAYEYLHRKLLKTCSRLLERRDFDALVRIVHLMRLHI